ncbi:hypothetical protein AMK59_7574 [Oryctes borbonicus]|uniref:Uncharacterized protein n=1 Tax=Oryctes borbonicus TaxID=1629725 RepID=A0A0T6AYM2_9SCAR|nr:hypothetical protein AMK59_7574 [Oryctes borbonicus]
MDAKLLENYISKVRCPRHLSIQYKFFDNEMGNEEDYSEFDSHIVRYINQCGSFLTSIHFESCRNDEILSLIVECPNLTAITLNRSKGNFESLLTLRNLEKIQLLTCVFPKQILQEILQNNKQLKSISSENSNLNANEICESLAQYNPHIEEVHMDEKRRVRAKGIKALSRCPKLRTLELVGGAFHCDPEDSLQHLAAGCPILERLTLYGWKDVNDASLMPILHSCTQLKSLDLRGINITIKSCREAALSLPFLKTLDVYKCHRIKKAEILKLQKEFKEIRITN